MKKWFMAPALAAFVALAVCGAAFAAVFAGNAGNNTLTGTNQADSMNGKAGNDTLFGRGGPDTMQGGDDDDTVIGEGGPDSVKGGPGDDKLNGGPGADTVEGSPGEDTARGGDGPDALNIADGEPDVFDCGDGDDTVTLDLTDTPAPGTDVETGDCEELNLFVN